MNNPLVSVIVISYNSAKYIISTLDSIKNQTYDNIQLIITDDSSIDSTLNLCHEWVGENRRRFESVEIVTSLVNTGTPANCNRGLLKSKGEFVKLIAADDLLISSCIKDNLNFSQNKGSFLNVSDMLEITEDNIKSRIDFNKQRVTYNYLKNKNKQLIRYLRAPIFINTPSFFFKADIFRKIGYFDDSFFLLEDQPFILKYLKAGYNLEFLNKYTIIYRTHQNSISNSNNFPKLANDFIKSIKLRVKYTNNLDIISFLYIIKDYFKYKLYLISNEPVKKYFYTFLYKTNPIYILERLRHNKKS